MAQTIVNLAVPLVTNKVEEVLSSYPTSANSHWLTSTALREKLVNYVLRRMPTVYATTENPRACAVGQPINCFSQEQQNRLDDLIDEGLQHLMNAQTSWETLAQSASQNAEPSPSHWFG